MSLKNIRRFLIMLLCMITMAAGPRLETFADVQERNSTGAATAGSFVLAAFSQNVTIIEPVQVDYEAGDTVKDALLDSGYTFAGIETGFMEEIEGTTGNFSLVFADGGFQLDTAADKVDTLFISERTDVNKESAPELVKVISDVLKIMEAYNRSADNVQNYPKASEAYTAVLTNMRTGNEEVISKGKSALSEAIKEYEELLAGPRRKVTVNVKQGSQSVSDANLEFTDEYGNITKATGNEIELRDGKYTFIIRDTKKEYNYTTNVGKMNSKSGGNWNTISNYFIVNGNDTSVNVKLAEGEWFGDITAEANASEALDSSRTIHDKEKHKIVFYVADSFKGGNVKPIFQKGTGTPTKDNNGTLSSVGIVPWVDFTYATGTNAGKKASDVATTANTNQASFGSYRSCLNFIDEGMLGNAIKADIKWLDDTEADKTDTIVMQGYDIEVKRFPTLKALSIMDKSGTKLLNTFDSYEYNYDITTITDRFIVETETFHENYDVRINTGENTAVNNNEITLSGNKGWFEIIVETEGVTTKYKVSLTKVGAAVVTLTMDTGVTAEVFNAGGSVILPDTVSGNEYGLVPGDKYTYVATKQEHYHTTAEFTATDKLEVKVALPEVKTVIKDFAVYDGSNKNTRKEYQWDTEDGFEVGKYRYIWYVSDAKSGQAFYVQSTSLDKSYTYWINHLKQTTTASAADQMLGWTKKTISSVVDISKNGTSLGSQVIATSGQGNELKLQVRKESSTNVTYYQEFIFDIFRVLTLKSLSISSEAGDNIPFMNDAGEALTYDRDILNYHVKIGSTLQSLILSGEFWNTKNSYSFDGGYYAMINGKKYEDLSKVNIQLDTNKTTEVVEIQVCHRDDRAVKQTYYINIEKQKPVMVDFRITPADSLVYLVNQLDNKTVYADDSSLFTIMPEVPYTYTISAPGYKTVQVENFQLSEPAENEAPIKNIEVILEKAPVPTNVLPDYKAQWPTFRGDKNGNGVVSANTPIQAEDTLLYWASKIGEGYDTGATGCPILVDGYLFTYAGNAIVKVDTMTGEVVASGTMQSASSFAINSPTYAEGMLFVGLSGGRVQAFNAETLESLWVYTDPKGGQPNCSIKYHDGYVYTGFWNSENKPANFVCISVTDEDPAQETEAKLASWRYTHNGFYWAGAYTGDDFVLVGTDDGEAGYTTGHASVLSFDPDTGKLIDEKVLPGVGDLRSDIMYDEYGTGDYYFTTKGGHLYRLEVNQDGTFGNLLFIKLDNYASNDSTPPMSTSTPVIYNGRAYIGVSGAGQFSAYSGHNITVVDLESWSIAYKVRTQGYPQTSGLLTTAYEKETGYVYVYFVDNYTPGKIRVLADKPGQKEPLETMTEAGYDVAKVLFTPTGAQAQYAICSPIADENGVIYFKNDSAHMMAAGPTIEKIEVTTMPEKTDYFVGEKFDKTGMSVSAVYTNGTRKDITKYISYSEALLTEEDTEFSIIFPHVMYQDKNGQTGVEYPEPMTSIQLRVTTSVKWVEDLINNIGTVSLESEEDITKAREAYNSLSEEEQSEISDEMLQKLIDAEETLARLKEEDRIPVNVKPPVITKQPESKEYKTTDTALPLVVEAISEDGGVLSYQWYSNEENVSDNATMIEGENGNTYIPVITEEGTSYYYCEITSFNENATGEKTAKILSEIAEIIVKKEETETPGENPGEEPGEEPGGNPGEEPGENPGETPGENPGEKPGEKPGENPGEEPGENPRELWVSGIKDYDFTGKNVTQKDMIVYHFNKQLVYGKDYTVKYKNNKNVGTATVIIKGKGNYTGTITETFLIKQLEISNAIIASKGDPKGRIEKAGLTVFYNLGEKIIKLKAGKDYDFSYKKTDIEVEKSNNDNRTNSSEYIVTVNGTGNYTGSCSYAFNIEGGSLNKAKINNFKSSLEWASLGVKQNAEIILKSVSNNSTELLQEGIDYKAEYINNKETGTATVIYTGMGDYTGFIKKTFKITGVNIKQVKIEGIESPIEYDGIPVQQNKIRLTYESKDGSIKELRPDDGSKTGDYTIGYKNNQRAGVSKIIFTGINGFTGKVSKTFKVNAYPLDGSKIFIETIENQSYKKGGIYPKPVIKYSISDNNVSDNSISENTIILREGVDYTLTYKNNKSIGDKDSQKAPTVIIQGKGGFKGKLIRTFNILPGDLSSEEVIVKATDIVYKNKAGICKPVITILDSNGKKLKAGLDYDRQIQYSYAEDVILENNNYQRKAGDTVENKDIIPRGTRIKATITGINNYMGSTAGVEFSYVKEMIKRAKIIIQPQTYTGENIALKKEDITIKLGQEILTVDDYEIAGYENNINVGKAKVTVRGIGNYGGEKTVTFTIKPYLLAIKNN